MKTNFTTRTLGRSVLAFGIGTMFIVLAAAPSAQAQVEYCQSGLSFVLDFDTNAGGGPLSAGTIVAEQWAAKGIHFSTSNNSGDPHSMMIFDTANPTGNDIDLGAPNQTCPGGGPGIGAGGVSGSTYENCAPLGNTLILSTDENAGNPNDWGPAPGEYGVVTMTFDQDVQILKVALLDTETSEDAVEIFFNDAALTSPDVTLAKPGDNGFVRTDVSGQSPADVRQMDLKMYGSGSFPDIELCYFDNTLPVEMSSFDVKVDDRTALLEWTTDSEAGNAGFAVEHKTGSTSFEEIGWIAGRGTTTGRNAYTFSAERLSPGMHEFRLRQVDFDGTESFSQIVEASVEMPGRFILEPAYPNPFNPSTTVRFAIAESAPVQMALYTPLGEQVRLLYQGVPQAGESIPVRIDASGLPSGVYLVRMTGSGIQASQTITLTK